MFGAAGAFEALQIVLSLASPLPNTLSPRTHIPLPTLILLTITTPIYRKSHCITTSRWLKHRAPTPTPFVDKTVSASSTTPRVFALVTILPALLAAATLKVRTDLAAGALSILYQIPLVQTTSTLFSVVITPGTLLILAGGTF